MICPFGVEPDSHQALFSEGKPPASWAKIGFLNADRLLLVAACFQ
jgi:hypothetical protein